MPPINPLKPFWQTADSRTVRLYAGNALTVLRRLPTGSVQCAVTSPPYWGQRAYASCERCGEPLASPVCAGKRGCGHTNEWYEAFVASEIGREPAVGQYVENLVTVFRELKRVLRNDGTFWLNLGDSYSGGGRGSKGGQGTQSAKQLSNGGTAERVRAKTDLPSGNLVGAPWRVAFALQDDGWVLRQDIIWAKPSPMPESVRNRCTKAHEYVFLLTKTGSGYYYDRVAVAEPQNESEYTPWQEKEYNQEMLLNKQATGVKGRPKGVAGFGVGGRNKRSVWTFVSQGYEGAHFATFPLDLPLTCIKAGTSEKGCCPHCGAPWTRVTEERKLKRSRPNDYVKRTGVEGTGNSCANSVAGVEVVTVGWRPGCECVGRVELGEDGDTEHPLPYEPVPCTVLDCFIGSGTTCVAAIELGRASVGIDLSEVYLKRNALPRVEGWLLNRPAKAWLAGRKGKAVTGGEKC